MTLQCNGSEHRSVNDLYGRGMSGYFSSPANYCICSATPVSPMRAALDSIVDK